MVNIVVSGLTAAGKTTHALLLARRLSFDYVSASRLMLAQLEIEHDPDNSLWVTRMQEIEDRRDRQPVDSDVNKLLVSAFRTRTNTVFDSWSLPWLTGSVSCLRVWIESSQESRAMKARVSQEPYGPFLSLDDCRRLIDDKDASTARRFQPLLEVDIRSDRSVFDLIVDNSDLIAEPTIESARQGISTFHRSLMASVLERLPGDTHHGKR
ncbi:cytidylate kinase family protein [Streptosporangium sp. LJ11]|uniref:cytidylate kinase family protein n=1 Tax=Streptosporangium sp. LJ11 TaxID=3436927 RepID=UPI003F7A36E3